MDPAQNHGYVGCTSCTGCDHTDESWLVARSIQGFDDSQCRKKIEVFAYDTQKTVTVPIEDKMMAGDRNANDLDLSPAVARALGFNPTPNNFGPNKRIKWRFVG